MIPHKFNNKLILLAIIGIALFIGSNMIASLSKDDSLNSDQGAPKVSKSQALSAALAFIQTKTPQLTVTDTLVVYESNKPLSAYLQKYNLTKAFSEKYGSKAPLDYWQVQVWDETKSARYIIDVGMDKDFIVGWAAQIDSMSNDQTIASARGDSGAARSKAEQYLRQAGYDLSTLLPLSPSSEDHTFNKESQLFKYISTKATIGSANQQLLVEVLGQDVTAFHINFTVPESDILWLSHQEYYAQKMSLISLISMAVFALAAIIIAIRRRKLISFGRGWILTGLFLVISFISSFNTLPSAGIVLGRSNTAVYLVIYMLFNLGIDFLLAVAVYFCLISGVQLWQEKGWNAWTNWREIEFAKDVFYGMGRGYLICVFVIGVQQVLFLFAGKAFHSFAINDPSQSEYNMLWPAIFPTMAWMAAISEEIIFRLFAIALLRKLLRNWFLAILIPSVAWALGHTAYTIYPSYTRLFEVAILGFIFSVTFLRYGLITAIFTHATMDSLLMGLSLLVSAQTTGYSALGILYILLPGIIGYAIMLLRRKPPKPYLTI